MFPKIINNVSKSFASIYLNDKTNNNKKNR